MSKKKKTHECKHSRLATSVKIVVFIAGILVFIAAATRILHPLFRDQYDRDSDFYAQEDNTIETIFMGSSVIYMGVSPMELYEDYGICSYNLATNSQPVLASYYWLLEAYDHHEETLTTVVMDASMFRRDTAESAYQKALWGMSNTSVNKYHAIRDITDTLESFASYMLPLYTWHARWDELESDTLEALQSDRGSYMRGYYYSGLVEIEREDYDVLGVPGYSLNESADDAELFDEAVIYFDKMYEFCQKHDIELVIVKSPCTTDIWTDSDHNIVSDFLESYGIELIDFNYSPLLEELDFNAGLDLTDDRHMNYTGACKFTAWIGEYLTEYCDATDVRGDEKYAFMDDQLEAYKAYVASRTANDDGLSEEDEANLALYNLRCEDAKIVNALHAEKNLSVAEYLTAFFDNDSYLVMITVQEGSDSSVDSGGSLTSEDSLVAVWDLDSLSDSGFTGLAALESGQTYAGVIVDGEVRELVSADGSVPARLTPIEGVVVSGGERASVLINMEQWAMQEEGLNIVVYNTETELVIDSVVFGADGAFVFMDLTQEEDE